MLTEYSEKKRSKIKKNFYKLIDLKKFHKIIIKFIISLGFIEYASEPFKLVLSPTGQLLVISSNGYIVWGSKSNSTESKRPYKLSLLDEGRLVITDINNKEIWESWPNRGLSLGLTIFQPIEYRYIYDLIKSKKKLFIIIFP